MNIAAENPRIPDVNSITVSDIFVFTKFQGLVVLNGPCSDTKEQSTKTNPQGEDIYTSRIQGFQSPGRLDSMECTTAQRANLKPEETTAGICLQADTPPEPNNAYPTAVSEPKHASENQVQRVNMQDRKVIWNDRIKALRGKLYGMRDRLEESDERLDLFKQVWEDLAQ